MNDSDVGSEGLSSESVEEWLTEIADAEGLSREETLADLVSSYWKLEEIFHLFQDTSIDLDHSPGAEDADQVASESDLENLRRRVDQLSDELASQADSVSKEEVVSAIAELDGRLGTVEEQFSDVSRGLTTLLDSPRAEPRDIADRLSTLENRMNRLEANLSEVDDRLEDVAETMISTERFEAHAVESEAVHEAIQREQQSIKERVRTEFGNIRTILVHLLETAGDDEKRARRIGDDLESELRAHVEEQATLTSLLDRANRDGICTATCQQCGHSVDLSLLEVAACPNCEQRFDRIRTELRYWGLQRRYVLTRADESAAL